jgi:glycosyltransferase involved in cell wall biosynthesis
MGELLRGGGQIVCDGFDALRSVVEQILSNEPRRRQLGETGYRFARTFTPERMRRAWDTLVRSSPEAVQ